MTNIKILYFNVSWAIKEHDWIIVNSGGLEGTKDKGQLESVLSHIQNDIYYPTFLDKINHLVFSLIKFHAFNDGNKRSAIALGAYFLTLNGYSYCVNHFTLKLENIAVWVAENKISKDLLRKIIESLMTEDDYSEELKLEILTATF